MPSARNWNDLVSVIAKFLNKPISKLVRDGVVQDVALGGAEGQTLRRAEGRRVVEQRSDYSWLIV